MHNSWSGRLYVKLTSFHLWAHMKLFSSLCLKRAADDENLINKWLHFFFFKVMYEKRDSDNVEFVSCYYFWVPDYSLWFSLLQILSCPASEACLHVCRPVFLSSCLWQACNPQRKSRYPDNTVVDLACTAQNKKGRPFWLLLFWH